MKNVLLKKALLLSVSVFMTLSFFSADFPGRARASDDARGISVVFNSEKPGSVSGDVHLYDRFTAVVIGIDRYLDLPAENQLQYAVKDAEGVAGILKSNYRVDKLITLYNEEATKARIMKILQGDLSNAGEEDAVLIYFAGHGITRSTTQGDLGYLVPTDGSLRHDEMYKNISMQQIKSDVCPLIPAKHVLIIADACFGGLLLTRSGSMEPSRDITYLKEITREQVRQIITAGDKDQTVLDGGPGGHSVFTGRLIQELSSAEDFITGKELGLELRKKVHGDAMARGHSQMPMVGEIYGTGDFVFVPDMAKRHLKAEDEVQRLERDLESLEQLKATAKQNRKESELREIERQRLLKESELKHARLLESAAREDARLKQAAENAAMESKTQQEQREVERQQRLANLRLRANEIRNELGSPADALGMEDAAKEILRINGLLEKLESDFTQSLQAQLTPVRQYYATLLADTEKIEPRDKMFETEKDYEARTAGIRRKADALRAELSAKENGIRGNVLSMLEQEKAGLVKQREELMAREYTLGPGQVDFKLTNYDPAGEIFCVELVLNKNENHGGVCGIPKSEAKLFYQNPDLLVPSVVISLSMDAKVHVREAAFSGPDNRTYFILNHVCGSELKADHFYLKLKSGVVQDTRNGLEWYVGPDKDTNWHEANAWVNRLQVDGGGWRMPTRDELKRLFKKGVGSRNMTSLLETTGWWVWSGEKKDSSSAWAYNFAVGREGWDGLGGSDANRAFAVRSR